VAVSTAPHLPRVRSANLQFLLAARNRRPSRQRRNEGLIWTSWARAGPCARIAANSARAAEIQQSLTQAAAKFLRRGQELRPQRYACGVIKMSVGVTSQKVIQRFFLFDFASSDLCNLFAQTHSAVRQQTPFVQPGCTTAGLFRETVSEAIPQRELCTQGAQAEICRTQHLSFIFAFYSPCQEFFLLCCAWP